MLYGMLSERNWCEGPTQHGQGNVSPPTRGLLGACKRSDKADPEAAVGRIARENPPQIRNLDTDNLLIEWITVKFPGPSVSQALHQKYVQF